LGEDSGFVKVFMLLFFCVVGFDKKVFKGVHDVILFGVCWMKIIFKMKEWKEI
jgi:hypothetical protein